MYNPYGYQYLNPRYLRSSKQGKSIVIKKKKKTENTLPAVFSRQAAAKQLGYTISAKTLANLDAKGLGPTRKLHIGGNVAYEKENFLECLKQGKHIKSPQGNPLRTHEKKLKKMPKFDMIFSLFYSVFFHFSIYPRAMAQIQ